MLQFIKGTLESYNEIISHNIPEYNDALFLDTDNNRIYFGGKPVDVRITVIEKIDSDKIKDKSYKFTAPDGKETVISDAVIPSLTSKENTETKTTLELRNMTSQTDNEYSNGLYNIKDKFLLEAISNVLGISLKYTYYANLIPISNRENGSDVTEDVIVYQKDDGNWYYDYDAYTVITTDHSGVTHQLPVAAGTEQIDESLVRVKSIDIVQKPDTSNLFDGGTRDDSETMLTKHGGLEISSVGDLEKLTVSEVLGRILFEDAKPVKLSDTSAYIRFADTYSSTKYIEVGSNYPRPDGSDFVIDFIPEKWQCVKSDNSSYGDVQIATQKTTVRYFLYDMEHPWKPGHGTSDLLNIYELTSEGYHEHYEQDKVDDGDKSQYYAYVSYTGTENIKDSDGNDSYVDNNGNTVYYRNVSAIDTSTRTVNTLRYTGSDSTIDKDEYSASLTLIAGWKIYTNASDVSTNSIWNDRYIEPAVAFRGNNEMIDTTIFSGNNVKFYAKWPGETTEEQKFYVYVQNSYKIGNIGGAHDTIKDDWTAELGSNLVSSDITITNGNQVNGTYKKYEITKSAGITNAEITIIKENN